MDGADSKLVRRLREVVGVAITVPLVVIIAIPVRLTLAPVNGCRRAGCGLAGNVLGAAGHAGVARIFSEFALAVVHRGRQAGRQAVVINWPDRATWPDRTVEIRVFLHGSGEETFQPMAILLPRRGRVRTVDFGQAFRDFRHDRPAALRRAEARLLGFLDAEVAT